MGMAEKRHFNTKKKTLVKYPNKLSTRVKRQHILLNRVTQKHKTMLFLEKNPKYS